MAGAALALVLSGCTTDARLEVTPTTTPTVSATSSPVPAVTPRPSVSPTPARPARFRSAAAMADVRLLAGQIGPRLATGTAFRRAAGLVARRFEELGYRVRRPGFAVPAGDSWGVPVRAGRSSNVVAEPPNFDPGRSHLLLGAHLDTVATAPGAEDNASGVAVMLEVARLASSEHTRLPVVFVAFGAEEPRGAGDALHHFGSRHYVRSMQVRQRVALRGMVSLDRVGVGDVVPVCTGPLSPPGVRRQLVRTARRIDVPTVQCANTASDHWSFEKAGFEVTRLGGTPYPAYHSPGDLPRVVNRRQLDRVGRLTWSWLR